MQVVNSNRAISVIIHILLILSYTQVRIKLIGERIEIDQFEGL